MAGACITRQSSAHNDGDRQANNDESEANVVHYRQGSIRKENGGHGSPGKDEVTNEDVPLFSNVVWVLDRIHLYGAIGGDDANRGRSKDPPVPQPLSVRGACC